MMDVFSPLIWVQDRQLHHSLGNMETLVGYHHFQTWLCSPRWKWPNSPQTVQQENHHELTDKKRDKPSGKIPDKDLKACNRSTISSLAGCSQDCLHLLTNLLCGNNPRRKQDCEVQQATAGFWSNICTETKVLPDKRVQKWPLFFVTRDSKEQWSSLWYRHIGIQAFCTDPCKAQMESSEPAEHRQICFTGLPSLSPGQNQECCSVSIPALFNLVWSWLSKKADKTLTLPVCACI